MSQKHGTSIEWTHGEGFKGETWNPVTGCSKVSPGCAHCYAETLSLRFGWSPKPWTPENAAVNVRLRPERLDQPLRWRKPRMIFVNSMSDLFHELIPDEYIDRVFAVMLAAPQHTFQVLTKRPERARDYFADLRRRYVKMAVALSALAGPGTYPDPGLPLPNVWLGVSIENARYTYRADVLREIPAAVRFISAEPLLGSLFDVRDDTVSTSLARMTTAELEERVAEFCDEEEKGIRGRRMLDLTGIDWLIAGGESGVGYRPVNLDWIRELRDACQTARVAFFLKQIGGRTPKSGGKELDGRAWCEMPVAA